MRDKTRGARPDRNCSTERARRSGGSFTLLLGAVLLLAQNLACLEVPGVNSLDAGPVDPDGGIVNEPDTQVDAGGCPQFPVAGIEVVVRDENGERKCDAVVTAREGAFEEVLQLADSVDLCSYFGVFERSGVYSVLATAPGYQTASETGIQVSVDACGDAETQAASLTLVVGEDPPADAGPGPSPEPPFDGGGDPIDAGPGPSPDPEPSDPPPLECPAGLTALEGDVVVSASADLTQLDGVECVSGTLTFTQTDFTDALLPSLQVIGRDLIVTNAPSFETLRIQALDEVGRDVVLKDAAALARVDVDTLQRVGRHVELGALAEGLPALADLDEMSSLTFVGGDLAIEDTGIQSLNQIFGSLTTVVGTLRVIGNPDLGNIRMLNGMDVLGSLVVRQNDSLTSVRARDVVTPLISFETTDNPLLETFDFRGLETISSTVTIDSCSFADADFRDLTSIGGDLIVTSTEIDQIDNVFGALSTVGGTLNISDNAALPQNDAETWAEDVTATTTRICGNENGPTCP